MQTDTQLIADYLARTWQAPPAAPDAVARILQAAEKAPQFATASVRFPRVKWVPGKPLLGLAAAASVALVMVWTGTTQIWTAGPVNTHRPKCAAR
jgi:hypothetical protein